MSTFFYFVSSTVYLLILGIQLLMMIRIIMQFFPNSHGSPFSNVVYGITEAVIMPMRLICAKSAALNNSPIDMPFLFTYVTLSFIKLLL